MHITTATPKVTNATATYYLGWTDDGVLCVVKEGYAAMQLTWAHDQLEAIEAYGNAAKYQVLYERLALAVCLS